MKKRVKRISLPEPKGQGLLELAIILPILLMMLLGIVELGLLLNSYLALLDADRNAARFASDMDYQATDPNPQFSCDGSFPVPYATTTKDFYAVTACLVRDELNQERPNVTLDLSQSVGDDVVITAVAVTQAAGGNPVSLTRYPSAQGWSFSYHAYCAQRAALGLSCTGYPPNQVSKYTDAEIIAAIDPDSPNVGLMIVEVYYHYKQQMGLPWLAPFVPNPVPLYARAVMPLSSAEPR